MGNKLVKDYLGNLVPKSKAHKIHDKYYVEGESCFLMEDNQWYRITSTDKIVFDHYKSKYIMVGTTTLLKGIINEKGEEGMFSENDDSIVCKNKATGKITNVLNEKIALILGYKESIFDGVFYDMASITDADLIKWFNKKNIPTNERSKSYNLESDPERKKQLEEQYAKLELRISPMAKRLSKFIGDYSFGMEAEVINGFIPRRIRNRLGLKALKDGSLRSDNGEGIEIVSMPMKGAKGIETIREFCKELNKRCEVNNYCSVHFHFGNVPKDKLYTLSLYNLGIKLQNEMVKYFPYSRFNSIKADGKIYCKLLQPLGVHFDSILKQKSEETFQKTVVNEFDKIYKWLNHGKGLAEVRAQPEIIRTTIEVGGKKMFYDKWLKNIYTTKSVFHSIQGEKWNKFCSPIK